MSQPPDPLNTGNIVRASRIGIVLGVAGIVLFIVLYVVLGPAGIDQVPRLVISICVPPALIAVAVGSYFLLIQPRNPDDG